MKTSSIRLRVRVIAAAVWTVWLGFVVLKNVGLVDSFLVLNHHPSISPQQRLSQPTLSPLFLKRPSSTITSSSSTTATTTPKTTTTQQKTPCLEWIVYVDQSEASLDKGGSATLDAFLGLAPAATVQVKAALLPMGSYYASSSSSSSSPNSGSSSGASGGNSNTNNSNNNSVGPFVRCIPLRREKSNVENNDNDDDDGTDSRRAFDVCNVDSVDKVYRILTKHMRVQGVTTAACDCLKWKYKANGFLEAGQISLAIEAYDKALEIVAASKTLQLQQQQDNSDSTIATRTTSSTTSYRSSSSSSTSSLQHQEGALYLMRATAYLQRARRLRKELKGTMLKFTNLVSSSTSTSSLSKSHQPVTSTLLKTVAKMANDDPSNSKREEEQPSLLASLWGGSKPKDSSSASSSSTTAAAANNAAATVAALQQSIFRRMLRDAQAQEFQFRRTLYMHGLYQHTLLQAAQDALYSTELLPDYPTAWQQAGDVFSDLWKRQESTLFYQRAIHLDNDDSDSGNENKAYSSLDDNSSSSRPQRRRLETMLKPVIERLKRRQQLLDQARSYYGWSEDTLRLALDVAATSMQVALKRP